MANPVNLNDPNGEKVSVFTRSLDLPFIDSTPYVHCVLVVETCEDKKVTYDFQSTNIARSPAQRPKYPVKNGNYTQVYDGFEKDELVLSMADKMVNIHQSYDVYNYNCCHWVKEVLNKSGLNWNNPNIFPVK